MSATIASPAQVGPRFQLVSALPTATSILLLGSIVLAGAPSHEPRLNALRQHLGDIGLIGATGLLVSVLVLGLAIHPFQYALVQLLEGYWPARDPFRHFAIRGIRAQLERRDQLEDRRSHLYATAPESGAKPAEAIAHSLSLASVTRRLQDYPQVDERVLPTRLGNVLRTREDLAGDRFGLDAIAVIPRLYPLIPDSQRAMIEDARSSLDLNVRFTVTWLITGLMSSALLFTCAWWNLVPFIMYTLGYVSYRGSIAAGRGYGNLLIRTVDLYRLELLKQVAFPPPIDLEDERKMFAAFLELASGMRMLGKQAGTHVRPLPRWCHEAWSESTRFPKRTSRPGATTRPR